MPIYAQFAADCTGRIYTLKGKRESFPDAIVTIRVRQCKSVCDGYLRTIKGFDTRRGFVSVPPQSRIFYKGGSKYRYASALMEQTIPGDYIYDRHKTYSEPDKKYIYLRLELYKLENGAEKLIYRARISPLEMPKDLLSFAKSKI